MNKLKKIMIVMIFILISICLIANNKSEAVNMEKNYSKYLYYYHDRNGNIVQNSSKNLDYGYYSTNVGKLVGNKWTKVSNKNYDSSNLSEANTAYTLWYYDNKANSEGKSNNEYRQWLAEYFWNNKNVDQVYKKNDVDITCNSSLSRGQNTDLIISGEYDEIEVPDGITLSGTNIRVNEDFEGDSFTIKVKYTENTYIANIEYYSTGEECQEFAKLTTNCLEESKIKTIDINVVVGGFTVPSYYDSGMQYSSVSLDTSVNYIGGESDDKNYEWNQVPYVNGSSVQYPTDQTRENRSNHQFDRSGNPALVDVGDTVGICIDLENGMYVTQGAAMKTIVEYTVTLPDGYDSTNGIRIEKYTGKHNMYVNGTLIGGMSRT